MEGFKIKCIMCNGDNTELYEKNIYNNLKVIGFDIYFVCNECQWEEKFKEVRYPIEEPVEFKDAFYAWYHGGKTIYCDVHDGEWNKEKSVNHAYDNFPAYAIAEGKWYIK